MSPPPTVGIIGAGQLARMTYQAAIGLGVRVRALADDSGDSAAQVMRDVAVGSSRAAADLAAFAAGCDVVTFDHELAAPADLEALEAAGHRLEPSVSAKLHAQDKLHQRRRLEAAGLPVPPYAPVSSTADIAAFAQQHGWPVVAKAVRGGYDGRGVWVLDDPADAEGLVARAGAARLLAEAWVPIEREIAVLVARRRSGETICYPVTETVQRDGMCRELLVPARVPAEVQSAAVALGRQVAQAIGATGVLAVELFATDAGLLVNEVALRPHNSGHWTIEGARTSQFANHLRAVLDWPLGHTDATAPAVVTVNLVGDAAGVDLVQRVPDALAVPGVSVHLYGKEARPGRKLGHVTALGTDLEETRGRAHRAAAVFSLATVGPQ